MGTELLLITVCVLLLAVAEGAYESATHAEKEIEELCGALVSAEWDACKYENAYHDRGGEIRTLAAELEAEQLARRAAESASEQNAEARLDADVRIAELEAELRLVREEAFRGQ